MHDVKKTSSVTHIMNAQYVQLCTQGQTADFTNSSEMWVNKTSFFSR